LREEAMTGKASDFPTLALSRSGNTGISQPSTKKGTPSHLVSISLLFARLGEVACSSKHTLSDNDSSRKAGAKDFEYSERTTTPNYSLSF
jgi:hypothetical protein